MKPSDKMEESNLSKVNIPITLKIEELEKTINLQVDGVLFENGELADENADNLKIKAEKTENITISFDNNHINYILPLKLLIKKEIASVQVDTEGEIALSLSTEFNIKKNWKLTTYTKVIKYKWIRKPYLRVGMFELPVKFIVNTILNKSKTLLCTKLDEEIAKKIDLRYYIQEAWRTLQSPILASKEFDLWILLSPVKAGMSPLLSDGEAIKSTIMVQTYAKALIGEKPIAGKEIPLPTFYLSEAIEEGFYLFLETEIMYSEAEKIARKYMVGKTFSRSIANVKVEDLKLYYDIDQLRIETQLSGTFNGDLNLRGKPVLNHEKNEIEIENITYKLNTRNTLIRFFNWLFQRRINRILENHSRVQLTEKFREVINTVEKTLENYEITDNVFLNGSLNKLKIKDLQLFAKAFKLTITSSGKLNLFIKKIEIKTETEN